MSPIDAFRGGRIYLDANVFIYAVEGYPKYLGLCSEILSGIQSGAFRGLTSELTLAEVLVRPLREGASEVVAVYEELLQSRTSFDVIPVTRALLRRSSEIRALLGCRLPDALHAATAEAGSADVLLTADQGFKVPGALSVSHSMNFSKK